MDFYEIGAVVVGFIGLLVGGFKAWQHIPREIEEAFRAVADAVEDDDISREDLKKIVEEFMDVLNLIRKVF